MSETAGPHATLAELTEDVVGGLWGRTPDSAESGDTDVLVVRGADFATGTIGVHVTPRRAASQPGHWSDDDSRRATLFWRCLVAARASRLGES